MILEYAVKSHQGAVREKNEDNFYLNGQYRTDLNNGVITFSQKSQNELCDFAVCDGIGGESYGEIASLRAVQTLAEFHNQGLGGSFDLITQAANETICHEMKDRGARRMGTTYAQLHLAGGYASVCNVGDSRIFIQNHGSLFQLTKDHRRESELYPGSSVLTQHLGIRRSEFVIEPHIVSGIELDPGMLFILCTDGLTDLVSDYRLQMAVDAYKGMESQQIAEKLVDLSLSNGGLDNVTVVIVKVVE